jgi:DNA-binding XRE family transcriptional regulator
MDTGKRLKQARTKAGLTQIGLARLVGVGQTQIANIENGLCTPSFKLAIKLVDLFGPEIFLKRRRVVEGEDYFNYRDSELMEQRKKRRQSND